MARLKPQVKIAGIAIGAIGLVFGASALMKSGVIPTPSAIKSMIPEAADATLSGKVNLGAPAQSYELAANPAQVPGVVRVLSIPWNGMGALSVANGGARTADGSLMQKYAGGTTLIERQDDYAVIRTEMVKFAQGVANGEANPDGAAFGIIMGDGFPAFANALKGAYPKGQEFKVIGVAGFSYGEDKCMGRPLDGDKSKAKGSLIAAVPYDGDWNICVKWASDNGIKVNTDNTTYDPDAINFTDTTSFTEADEKYIAGACEERTVVKDGLKTKETKRVCVDGVATWTPGDVAVVQQKGGLQTWASTKEYNYQMPAIIIANVEWANKNADYVVGMLKAIDRGAFAIRTERDGLERLGKAQAAIHGQGGGAEGSPDFWSGYYAGKEIRDPQGNKVHVGGSRAATLAEVRDFLGITKGSYNVYKGVYETFGDYAKTFYPKDVPSYPKYEDVVDTSFVTRALAGVTMGAPTTTAFAEQKSISRAVSSRAYSIEFETGSAKITPASMRVLNEIANGAGMTNLRIRIAGHTDNTGDSALNLGLSRARADAIANALTALAPSTFPRNRMEVQGFGDTSPVADNTTAAGRAKNRRVEITLGE